MERMMRNMFHKLVTQQYLNIQHALLVQLISMRCPLDSSETMKPNGDSTFLADSKENASCNVTGLTASLYFL